jgi:hypothetical protein
METNAIIMMALWLLLTAGWIGSMWISYEAWIWHVRGWGFLAALSTAITVCWLAFTFTKVWEIASWL